VQVREIAGLLRSLILTSDEYRHDFARRAGIGMTDATALGHLFHDGPQNLGHIAGRLNLTPGAVTALADRMAAAGYLTRTPHPNDRRQSLIGLTQSGTRLMKQAYDTFASDIDHAIADAKPAHRRELCILLSRVTAALHARDGEPGNGQPKPPRDRVEMAAPDTGS
jgi:DNA-binding MarR family transcriptional regulator